MPPDDSFNFRHRYKAEGASVFESYDFYLQIYESGQAWVVGYEVGGVTRVVTSTPTHQVLDKVQRFTSLRSEFEDTQYKQRQEILRLAGAVDLAKREIDRLEGKVSDLETAVHELEHA